jgi:hypothetical protein
MKYLLPLIVLTGALSACNDDDDDARNTAPSVTAPAAQSAENTGSAIELDFNVSDDRDALSALMVSASSDNADLFPANNILVDAGTSAVTVSIVPEAVLGSATITLTVVDSEGLSSSASSSVEVTAETIEFNALARRVFDQAPNSQPQNLDILDIQEGNPSDDFADLL